VVGYRRHSVCYTLISCHPAATLDAIVLGTMRTASTTRIKAAFQGHNGPGADSNPVQS
jgi:hypothetical protein